MGLIGVGGGMIVVPTLLTFTSLTFRQATASSMVAITGFSFSGLMGHLMQGNGVPIDYALPFTALCVIGLFFGRGLAGRLPEKWLTKAFSLTGLAVAIGILIKEFV